MASAVRAFSQSQSLMSMSSDDVSRYGSVGCTVMLLSHQPFKLSVSSPHVLIRTQYQFSSARCSPRSTAPFHSGLHHSTDSMHL